MLPRLFRHLLDAGAKDDRCDLINGSVLSGTIELADHLVLHDAQALSWILAWHPRFPIADCAVAATVGCAIPSVQSTCRVCFLIESPAGGHRIRLEPAREAVKYSQVQFPSPFVVYVATLG
jgi:hypothetical protein